MPAAEIAFEYLALALEGTATRGTAVTPPTHYLPYAGKVTPFREKYRPDESRGTLAETYRSKTVRAGAKIECEGGFDVNYAPLTLAMLMKSVTAPTTPTNGVLTRLWTYSPTMTSDDIRTATAYFGDPGVQIFQSVFTYWDELTITADATGTNAVQAKFTGAAQFPTRVSAPTAPTQNVGSLLMPSAMQLWIDIGATAIGTTEITGRFIKSEWKIPTGGVPKYYAKGPTSNLSFTKIGRKKRHAEAKIVVELNDLSIGASQEYRLWESDTIVKMRIRLNGSLIESVTPDYYEYLQLDIYGPLDAFAWGDVEGTNRTMEFTVMSESNATAATDFVLYAQNTKTTI